MSQAAKKELLLQAVTSSIDDRYGIVWDAYMEEPEIFKDDCLRPALVACLSCTYSDLANLVVRILKLDDATIVPLLKEEFDPKGKKEMVRRMEVLDAVAGATENDFYLSVLGVAEKKVREAVIYALRHDENNIELLIQLAGKEKGECKKKAILALAQSKGTGSREFFEAQLKKNWLKTVDFFEDTDNEAISDIVASELQKLLDTVESTIQQGKYLLEDEDAEKLRKLLHVVYYKSTDSLLDAFRRYVEMAESLKHAGKVLDVWGGNATSGERKTNYFSADYIAWCIKWSNVNRPNRRLMDFAYEMFEKYPESFAGAATITALFIENAKDAYDKFSFIIETPVGEGNERMSKEAVDNACEAIAKAFANVAWDEKQDGYIIGYSEKRLEDIDCRWVKAFTKGRVKVPGEDLHTPAFSRENSMYGCDWNGVLYSLMPEESRYPQIYTLIKNHFTEVIKTATLEQLYKNGSRLKGCGVDCVKGAVVEAVKRKTEDGVLYLSWAMEEVPMSVEEKLEELQQIKELQDKGEVEIKGWKPDTYEKLCEEVQDIDED